MIRYLLTPVRDDSTLTRLRQRFIRILAGVSVLLAILVTLIDSSRDKFDNNNALIVVMAGIGIVILVLAQARYINLAALLLVATLVFTGLQLGNDLLLPGLLAVLAAATLAGRRVYFITNVLVIGKQIAVLADLMSTSGTTNPFDYSGAFGTLIALIIVSLSTRYFIRVMEQAIQRAYRNAALLQATTEIGEFAATMLDLNALFSRSVELVKERFGFYHVQVFMINGDQAELVASTGEVGQRLLANKHRLPVGSNSVIGHVTRYGQTVLARSTDAIHRANPLLPATRTELAVPIFEGEKVIGAVDMQSTVEDAFKIEDVEALRSMANLLSAAIRNARLFESQQRSIADQQRLYLESEASLREIQRLNRQLTKAGWDEFVRHSSNATGVTLQNEQLIPDSQWSDSLIEAARQRQVVTRKANGRSGVVAVPVVLRGEVIGAIEVEPGDSTIQGDTIEMVQAIAQRLASSLDNARLYEEAQVATAQEQRINQIVTRYQAATTVDDLLRITLTELSEALGAQRGAIRLGRVPDERAHLNGGSAQ
jgi:GAF domain-containing protein